MSPVGSARSSVTSEAALYEIQLQESEQENDGVPAHTASLNNGELDPVLLTGRVLHTHGPGIDQPLSTIRLAFGGWQPFAVIPVWDTQGRAPYILFADGTRQRCQSSSNCLNTRWLLGFRAYGSRTSGQVLGYGNKPVWLGNVLEDQHDASGLLYRRNRYYNPQTGRFTQEEPIGLAGGVNVYGFANGDPVTYADPYGLSAETNDPCDWANMARCIKELAGSIAAGFAAGAHSASNMVDGLAAALLRETGIQIGLGLTTEGVGNAARGMQLISRIKEVPALVRIASRLGGTAEQVGVDALTSRLAAGNMNPGLGNRYLFSGITEARHANGGRVYFRSSGNVVEVLAKSDKGSQDRVIRILREVYGR